MELSSATIKTVFTILKSALEYAEDKGFIMNIWSKVKLPKKEKSIVRILSVTEQQQLESYLTNKIDIGILISLYTGLRIGEVCALKWSDINFELNTLTVNGTQIRTEKGVEITSPKSRSSKREIPTPPFLQDKIKEISHNGEFLLSNYGKDSKHIIKKTIMRVCNKAAENGSFITYDWQYKYYVSNPITNISVSLDGRCKQNKKLIKCVNKINEIDNKLCL